MRRDPPPMIHRCTNGKMSRDVMGFQTFLDQDTMTYTDKIEQSLYLDASAYKEVLSLLSDEKKPQFVHLVTMQTLMPSKESIRH